MSAPSKEAFSRPALVRRTLQTLSGRLKTPLGVLLLLFLVSRLFLVLVYPESVRFISEEMYVGAAASGWRRALSAMPLASWMYSPYEGGSLWTMALTAGAQLLVGETLLSLKVAPLLLGCFSLASVYLFTEWLAGRRAAMVAGLLMLCPPLNILVQEL